MTQPLGARAKPTPADLGIDPSLVEWERSGDGAGSIEIAIPDGPVAQVAGQTAGQWARGDWVLMRVAADPVGRILVFDRNEWECFIDGARTGEFDDATEFGPGAEDSS
jgi:hypothetical protein